mmetsp:Transcript_38716/g.121357  ORF Transcript_38716/g.121357 Transcript_38716/m.121357 type:complete len:250 (-) Transcript_38716:480-1229(-)
MSRSRAVSAARAHPGAARPRCSLGDSSRMTTAIAVRRFLMRQHRLRADAAPELARLLCDALGEPFYTPRIKLHCGRRRSGLRVEGGSLLAGVAGEAKKQCEAGGSVLRRASGRALRALPARAGEAPTSHHRRRRRPNPIPFFSRNATAEGPRPLPLREVAEVHPPAAPAQGHHDPPEGAARHRPVRQHHGQEPGRGAHAPPHQVPAGDQGRQGRAPRGARPREGRRPGRHLPGPGPGAQVRPQARDPAH